MYDPPDACVIGAGVLGGEGGGTVTGAAAALARAAIALCSSIGQTLSRTKRRASWTSEANRFSLASSRAFAAILHSRVARVARRFALSSSVNDDASPASRGASAVYVACSSSVSAARAMCSQKTASIMLTCARMPSRRPHSDPRVGSGAAGSRGAGTGTDTESKMCFNGEPVLMENRSVQRENATRVGVRCATRYLRS